MKTKDTLRKQLLQQRNLLNSSQVQLLSTQIVNQLLSYFDFSTIKNIASYHAIGNEVNLSELLKIGNSIYLPVIQAKHSMLFRKFESFENLTSNKFGILEPQNTKTIQAKALEICFVPLVGFNRDGSRLGMGGGYYDRYFALNKFNKKPCKLVGIAYDFQENVTIQSDPWDIPLDLIITNTEIIKP